VVSAGVVGSGTMGSGIALSMLVAGIPVTLFDSDPAALQRGVKHVRDALEANVLACRMTALDAERSNALLMPASDIAALGDAHLIVEAAYEAMEVKLAVFAELDRVAKPGALLASNTSYLDIDVIAAATSRAADVLGLHFFSPANVMRLLEVVRGRQTKPDAVATAFALARRLGKVPVLAGNSHGFIGNRMLAVQRRHAEDMALQGLPPARIDAVVEDFGFPMGPFRVRDLAGLDLGWSAKSSIGSTLRDRLCEAGRRGRKVGAGFYDYDHERQPLPSDQANAIIAAFARENGIEPRSFTDEEILDRLLWPMVAEGAQLLAEGVALRESDIDVVWLNGYGWPAWTGGPMFHARTTGLPEVCRRLEAMGCAPPPALRASATGEGT
jgi:3-hydroxyacyl-CoA dehydrogenase